MKRERLVDYLDRRLGKHSGRGAELLFYCPACLDRLGSDGDKKKFAVNIDKQRGQCFRCEFKFRDMERLFRYINGGHVTPQERIMLRVEPPMVQTTVRQAVRDLLRKAEEAKKRKLRTHRLPRGAKLLDKTNTQRMPWKRPLKYLEGRGFTLEDAMRSHIHYCASGRYAGYMIFPVYQGGERVYWTSRYAGNGAMVKSWNPEKQEHHYSREHCLLGFDDVIGEKIVALVEGPIDRMAPDAAVALMGKEMSPFQIELIWVLVQHGLEELVVMLDPGTGSKIDQIYAATVDFVPTVRVCYLEGDADPAELKDEMDAVLAQRREPTLTDRIRSRLS